MEFLFVDGRMIDIAIAVLAAESLWIALAWRQRRQLLPTLLSGLMLMLAWRFHQAGLSWLWIAAPLLSSACWHAIDLAWRWPRASRGMAASCEARPARVARLPR